MRRKVKADPDLRDLGRAELVGGGEGSDSMGYLSSKGANASNV